MNVMLDLPITRILLEGTHRDMGTAHGEELRAAIRELAGVREDLVRSQTGVSKEQIELSCQSILAAHAKNTPEIFQETTATAKAANIPHWRLLVAGGYSDVLDCCQRTDGGVAFANECTIFVWKSAQFGSCVVGTWDSHASAEKSLVIVERHADLGQPTLGLSTAGWPIQQGINGSGLACAIANMVSSANAEGSSYISALPHLMGHAADSAEAYNEAKELSLCSARYYLFADSDGSSIGVESTGEEASHCNDPSPHTNHFLFEELVAKEGRPTSSANSKNRCKKAHQLLLHPEATIGQVFSKMAGTPDMNDGIEQLGVGHDDRSCASFVISPVKQKIWFTCGPPSSKILHEIEFTKKGTV